MKVYKYGDNVDTDVIIPAGISTPPTKSPWPPTAWRTSTPASASHRGAGATSSWPGPTSAAAPPGSTPPWPSRPAAVKCVIAPSFARIFYRNAINIGFPILECAEAAEGIQAGDTVSVDFNTGVITDETTGKTYQAAPLPEFVQGIVDNGGLLKSLKARGWRNEL